MGNEQSVAEDPGPQGKITVNIRATDESEECVVDLDGAITQIVTEADLAAFGLTIDKLKTIIKPINPDKLLPDYIIFNSPARVKAFLYTKQKAQCIKTLKPLKYTIIGKETETIAVGSRTLENRSQVKGTYTNNMSHTETNTIGTKWSNNNTAATGLTVEYNVVMPGSTEMSFSSSYGEEKEKTTTVTIGSESGVSVELNPGQDVAAKIRLIKHVYQIEIEYEASLSGVLAAVWDTFTAYKVRYYSVLDVMKGAGLENTATIKEVIKMEYFTDGEVVLTDKKQTSGWLSYVFGK